MSLTIGLLTCLAMVNGMYAIRLFNDVREHKKEISEEPGGTFFVSLSTAVIFFLSAFGVSDFAISTIVYRMKKLVKDKDLPGTLNTQCVLPIAVMAFAFISVVDVDIYTLTSCILAQVGGAYLGPHLTVRLSPRFMQICIGIGLILAMAFIVAGKLQWVPAGGTAIGLRDEKLAIALVCMFIFGALNNLGVGSYPLTLVTIYALGMSPIAAFPVMMGACAFSVPVGSMQFIKLGNYSRKITLFASIFGVLGVLAGVYLVKELDVAMLQWLVAGILLYSGVSMVRQKPLTILS